MYTNAVCYIIFMHTILIEKLSNRDIISNLQTRKLKLKEIK